jgi:hypothetical protein
MILTLINEPFGLNEQQEFFVVKNFFSDIHKLTDSL